MNRWHLLLALAAFSTLPAATADNPTLHRERIEWCDIWFTDAEKATLPRVLLVGDSITRGYFDGVEKAFLGQAYCGRMTTSRSVADPVFFQELALVLTQYPFAVIHVNNGLHGWEYTETEYRAGMEQMLDTIQSMAPQATVIVGTTTPVRADFEGGDKPARILARNKIAEELCAERKIAVDDLHASMIGHLELLSGDGVHFKDDGRAALAEQVAQVVGKALSARK